MTFFLDFEIEKMTKNGISYNTEDSTNSISIFHVNSSNFLVRLENFIG